MKILLLCIQVYSVHFILGDNLNIPRNRHDRTTRAFAFNRWLKTYPPDLCELQALIANLLCMKTVLQVLNQSLSYWL